MECNRMEWKGMEQNGIEWNRIGMEWNGIEQEQEWNGMEQNGIEQEWNGMEQNNNRVRGLSRPMHQGPKTGPYAPYSILS